MHDRKIVLECSNFCGLGFSEYDVSYYSKIDEKMSLLEQDKRVTRVRELCKVGPTLTSPRFLYPHILEELDRMGDTSTEP